MDNKGFIKSRVRSIGYAIEGIVALVRMEVNARIHLAATLAVVIAGILRHIDRSDWIAVSIAIALVWVAEGANTCIEMLCDLYSKGANNLKVKTIKDIGAGVTLIAAINSVVIGTLVFVIPIVKELFK